MILLVLLAVPALLWIGTPSTLPRFANATSTAATLGGLSGVLGTMLFAFSLILSTRSHRLEKLFAGLNALYTKHSLMGQWGLILMLMHPVLLLPRYATNIVEAVGFLSVRGDNLPKTYGIVALYSMVALIVLTLYLKPKYNIWKWTHKFLGAAFFLGSLHIYLIPSAVMHQNRLLKVYVLGFASLGILSFLYKTVFEKLFVKKYSYRVTDVIRLNKDIIEVVLTPMKELMPFEAGQFAFLSFHQKGLSAESHPFSLSSAPNAKNISITIKSSGDYTKALLERLRPEAIAKLEGPFGNFLYKKAPHEKQVWIAGGVGITPFISFLRDLALTQDGRFEIVLFYSVKKADEMIYADLFKKIKQDPQLHVKIIPFYSNLSGYLDAKFIMKKVPDLSQRDIFLCAPPPMIRALKKGCVDNSIPTQNLHSEEFNY